MPVQTLFLLALLAAGCSYPELAERGENAPGSHRCGECHIAIYEEWKDSPHAKSFSNPAFKEVTYDYRFEFCLGCHAPDSIYTPPAADGQTSLIIPAPRQTNLDEGVNCNGCHLTADCKLAGPLKAAAPHPVANVHSLYKKSVLCGTCHQGTYREWLAVSDRDRKSCQDCHMPSSERKLIQDAPWSWFYKNKPTRKHSFSSEDGLNAVKAPIEITLGELRAAGSEVTGVIELENLSIPHSIPTGDYGYKEAVLIIEITYRSGRRQLIKEESFFTEMDTALEHGQKKYVKFSFPGNLKDVMGSHLETTLLRRTFDGSTKIILTQQSMPANLSLRVDIP